MRHQTISAYAGKNLPLNWKKIKSEKLLVSSKCLLKYGRDEILMTLFSDYVRLCINNIQK